MVLGSGGGVVLGSGGGVDVLMMLSGGQVVGLLCGLTSAMCTQSEPWNVRFSEEKLLTSH